MKQKEEIGQEGIYALSFGKFLSESGLLKDGVRYGNHCCLIDVDTITEHDIFKYPVRIDAYIFVVCSKGRIELSYNIYNLTLRANSMFLYNPGTIVRINALEPSMLSILVFTREFVDELGIKFDNFALQFKILRENRTFLLTEKDCQELRTLMSITSDFISMNPTTGQYHEMVKSAFKAFIYRAIYAANQQYSQELNEVYPGIENSHFQRFMRLLEVNYKTHHSIRFYADEMNLTPKYLSMVIKKVSGKLATDWIDDYLILEAKNLVKYSSMNIQQIAYALNFPNQSFFGKYFKRHTGLSPKAYRQKP